MSTVARYSIDQETKKWTVLDKGCWGHTKMQIVCWRGVYELNIYPTAPMKFTYRHLGQFPHMCTTESLPRLYWYKLDAVFWNPIRKVWMIGLKECRNDILAWIYIQPAQPTRYRLIKQIDHTYEWIRINPNREDDGRNIEIETWKGVYAIRTLPKSGRQWRRYGFVPIFYGRWTLKQAIQIYHPIRKTGVKVENLAILIRDIIAWIEAQPPNPDINGAKQDRIEVEQTFGEIIMSDLSRVSSQVK